MCPDSNPEAAQALRELLRSRRDAGGGSGGDPDARTARRDRPPQSTLRALSGALHVDSCLRYKVKLWMYRRAAAPPVDTNSAMSEAAATTPTPNTQKVPVGAGGRSEQQGGLQAAARCKGGHAPHVAYCMMTVIIRNGLAQLKRGRTPYIEFARHAAENAGLPAPQVHDVTTFADAWHAWATAHVPDIVAAGTRAADRYLDAAERFVADFVAGAAHGGNGGAGGRFRGILVMVGFEADVVAGVAARLRVKSDAGSRPDLSRAAAVCGSLISMVPWTGSVRNHSAALFIGRSPIQVLRLWTLLKLPHVSSSVWMP